MTAQSETACRFDEGVLLQAGGRKPPRRLAEVDVRAGDQVPRVIDVVPSARYSKPPMQVYA